MEGDLSLERLRRRHVVIIARVNPIAIGRFGWYWLCFLLSAFGILGASRLYLELVDDLDVLFDLLLEIVVLDGVLLLQSIYCLKRLLFGLELILQLLVLKLLLFY